MRGLLAILLIMFLGILSASLASGQPIKEYHVSMDASCMSSGDKSRAFDIFVRSSSESVVPPPGLIEGCDIIVMDDAPLEIEIDQFYGYGRKSCPYLEDRNISMEMGISDRFVPEVNISGTEVIARGRFQRISVPFSEECQINGTGTAFLLVKPKGEEYVLNMPKGDKADLIFVLKDMSSRGKTIGGPVEVNVCTVSSSATGAMGILKDKLSPLFIRIGRVSKELSELPNRSCDNVEISGVQVPLLGIFKGPDISSLKSKLSQIKEKLREIVERKMVVTVKKWRDYEREQVIRDIEDLKNKLAQVEEDVEDASAAIKANYCVTYNLIATLGIPLVLSILLVLAVRRR